MYPVHTRALLPADVRFAASEYLLMKTQQGDWPGDGATRLAAILLVLFSELRAGSSASTIMGITKSELYSLLKRAVHVGGLQRKDVLRETATVDLVGDALSFAKSDALRRLWAPPAPQPHDCSTSRSSGCSGCTAHPRCHSARHSAC